MTPSVEVHVHSIARERARRSERVAVLTPEERKRMGTFRFDDDAMRFLVGRSLVREHVGRARGLSPRDVLIEQGPHGKPFVSAGPRFNVSHSGDVVLVAISEGPDVGIDVELVEPRNATDARLDMFFSPAEIAAHLALPAEQRLTSFFHLWTTKEALLKLAATGLSLPLQDFDTEADPGCAPALLATRVPDLEGPLSLHAIDVPVGYRAVLAVRASVASIVYG